MEEMGLLNLNNWQKCQLSGGWHVPRILRQSSTVLCFPVYICKREFIETIQKLCFKIQILLLTYKILLYYIRFIKIC
jgi:hypothetical protein